jgi:hypothetical protein
VTQLVHPLHGCAAEPLRAATDPAAVEPLHSTADPATAGAALTEISSLCSQV